MPYAALEDRKRVAREYARRRYRQQRPEDREYWKRAQRTTKLKVKEAARAAKLERGCVKCGYRSHPDALAFDHIVPKHKTGDGPVRIQSFIDLERILADPNIRVLCANCHAIKSNSERRERYTITIDPS